MSIICSIELLQQLETRNRNIEHGQGKVTMQRESEEIDVYQVDAICVDVELIPRLN